MKLIRNIHELINMNMVYEDLTIIIMRVSFYGFVKKKEAFYCHIGTINNMKKLKKTFHVSYC